LSSSANHHTWCANSCWTIPQVGLRVEHCLVEHDHARPRTCAAAVLDLNGDRLSDEAPVEGARLQRSDHLRVGGFATAREDDARVGSIRVRRHGEKDQGRQQNE
jgi:hypothetical protein